MVKFLEKAAALVGYRIHQCNFCDHISNKMSNIKQHLKGVHKNVELKAGDNGFTTTVKENSGGEKKMYPKRLKSAVIVNFKQIQKLR